MEDEEVDLAESGTLTYPSASLGGIRPPIHSQENISELPDGRQDKVGSTHPLRRADIQVVVSDLTQADSVFSLAKELRRRDLIHKVTRHTQTDRHGMYVCM